MFKCLIILSFLVAMLFASCSEWYQVKEGDTCWKIALDRPGSSVSQLQNANPGLKCDFLQIGQRLCTRQDRFKRSLGCRKFQVIRSGDTCYDIWTESQVGQSRFMKLNKNINCNSLQIGQTVCIE